MGKGTFSRINRESFSGGGGASTSMFDGGGEEGSGTVDPVLGAWVSWQRWGGLGPVTGGGWKSATGGGGWAITAVTVFCDNTVCVSLAKILNLSHFS